MNSDRFKAALAYAADAHATQVRKGTSIPYISHLLAVAGIALEHGASEDEAIAALLHDTVEDAGGRPRLQDVAARFGPAVAAIVEGCTDAEVEPKPAWRPRKEAYLAHLEQASTAVLLVCASDKLHNARSILADHRATGPAIWRRFNGGREGTLWYYRILAEVLGRRLPGRLSGELAATVAALEARAAAETGAP
jgi:(p)ppGpp synthase/HD superfamily hydrolase